MLKLSFLLICCAFFENLQAAKYDYNLTTKLCHLTRVPPDGKKYTVAMKLIVPQEGAWTGDPKRDGLLKLQDGTGWIDMGKSVIIRDMPGEVYDKLVTVGSRVLLSVKDESGAEVANGLQISENGVSFGNQYGESPPLQHLIACIEETAKCPYNFVIRYRYHLELYPSFAQEAEKPYAIVSFNSIKTTWDAADSNNALPAVSEIVHAATQACDPEWTGPVFWSKRRCDYEIAFTLACGDANVAQWNVVLPDDQENFEGRDDLSPKIMFTREQFRKCFMEDRGLGSPNGRLIVEVKDRDVRDIKVTLATHDFWLWKPGTPESSSYAPSFRCGAKMQINGIIANTLKTDIDLKCAIQMGLSVKLFNVPKILPTRYIGPHKQFAAQIMLKEIVTTRHCLPPQNDNDECKCNMLCLDRDEKTKCIEDCKKATFMHFQLFDYKC